MIDTNADILKIDIVDDNYKVLLSSFAITREYNKLLLHGDDFPLLPLYTNTKAIAYFKDGVATIEGEITLSIKKQINLTLNSFGTVSDRRRHLKVRTNEEAKIVLAVMGNRKIGLRVDDLVRLRDISLGGVCFFSNYIFLVGQKLHIEMYEVKKDLILEAKILRKEREEPGKTFRYKYACQFINTDEIQERIICEHVFKTELINHKKEVE